MKHITFIVLSILIFVGCSVSKKTILNEQKTDQTKNLKSSNGIYEPDSAELKALHTKYPAVALSVLKEGYIIYAYGPCINCHNAKNIYQYDELKWKSILDEMAVSANISEQQKDAVYKYILSIKFTQPKK
jgi:hypothetical protein